MKIPMNDTTARKALTLLEGETDEQLVSLRESIAYQLKRTVSSGVLSADELHAIIFVIDKDRSNWAGKTTQAHLTTALPKLWALLHKQQAKDADDGKQN